MAAALFELAEFFQLGGDEDEIDGPGLLTHGGEAGEDEAVGGVRELVGAHDFEDGIGVAAIGDGGSEDGPLGEEVFG
jgi:hypothetical protein